MNRPAQPNNQPVKLRYEDYFVAYLDVLGFRHLVMGNGQHNGSRIESFFELTHLFRDKWQKIKEKKHLKVVSVSDSIFLATKMTGDHSIDAESLTHLCIAIGDLQIALCTRNVWCRGAISYGPAYFNIEAASGEKGAQTVIFGPAIVKAVELEEARASYPRIILDTGLCNAIGLPSSGDLIRELNGRVRSAGWNNWKSSILHEWTGGREELNFFRKDYPLFIDYMGEIFDRTKIHEGLAKEIAENLLRSAGEAPHAYEKFRWAGDYMHMRGLHDDYPNRNFVEALLLQF